MFDQPRSFPIEERAFLLALAGQGAQALERARLYNAEQLALAEAEAAQGRLALLAEAGVALAGSLDRDTTLATLVQLTVPTFADWCTINLLDEGGFAPPVARHADPTRQVVLETLLARYPADPHGEGELATTLQTGQPVLLNAPRGELVPSATGGQAYRELIALVGFASTLVVPLRAHGRLLGALRFVRGEAARRYAQNDLRLAEELARRAALALDNAQLYHETQEALAARDRFLSIAAHELRTPVTSVRAYTQLVRRQSQRSLDPQLLGRALEAIEHGTGRLNVLIQDLLDVARLQSGQFQLRREPLDLVALLQTALAHEQLHLPEHLRLETDLTVPSYQVEADAGRLEQVLGNLLENARKYSPEAGVVHVSLVADQQGATIAVRDEGIGLAPGDAEKIFTPFSRSEESLRRQIPGLGLGLAICKAIVEQHGGTLVAESAGYGCGATFSLWLPKRGTAPIG